MKDKKVDYVNAAVTSLKKDVVSLTKDFAVLPSSWNNRVDVDWSSMTSK